jgi:hypothetical protein
MFDYLVGWLIIPCWEGCDERRKNTGMYFPTDERVRSDQIRMIKVFNVAWCDAIYGPRRYGDSSHRDKDKRYVQLRGRPSGRQRVGRSWAKCQGRRIASLSSFLSRKAPAKYKSQILIAEAVFVISLGGSSLTAHHIGIRSTASSMDGSLTPLKVVWEDKVWLERIWHGMVRQKMSSRRQGQF